MNCLPRNGDALLRMRREGMRPEGVTLISLIGNLPYSNFTLYADPGVAYNWTPIAGLDVEIIASLTVPFRRVLVVLAAMAGSCPGHMSIGFTEGPRVECGQARYAPETLTPPTGRMEFDWYPMAIGRHRSSATIARRLWSEIGASIPAHFDAALHLIANQLSREIAHGADHS